MAYLGYGYQIRRQPFWLFLRATALSTLYVCRGYTARTL